MAEITASLVKELRTATGAGMMDCKKALKQSNGDMEAATHWLRAKGLSSAAKKAGRAAAEGLVGTYTDGKKGVVIEVNAETDFVGRTKAFQNLVLSIMHIALEKNGDKDSILVAPYPKTGRTVEEEVQHSIATIGENMNFRRAQMISVNEGIVASYVHSSLRPGLGKIGVLVGLESSANEDFLQDLGRKIAMHIAAARPQSLGVDDLSKHSVEKERAVFKEQAENSGKPIEIIEKMIVGRLRKFYQEVVLLEQTFVVDNENTIANVIKNAEKEAGTSIALTGFACYCLGEGIEKKKEDFAAEVAAAVKG